MKALVRVFIVFLSCLLLALLGYFVLTLPGVQKKIIQSKLPEGSSITYFRLTPNELTIKEVQYDLPDKSRLKIDVLSGQFSIWDAFFNDTLHIQNLELSGVDIDLSNTIPSPNTDGKVHTSETRLSTKENLGSSTNELFENIYKLGQSPWLIVVDRLRIDGTVQTNKGNQFQLSIQADELKPGVPGMVELLFSASMSSEEFTQLSGLSGAFRLEFLQKETGGLERLQISSEFEAKDGHLEPILNLVNKVDFSLNAAGERSNMSADWTIDIHQPQVFLSEAKDIHAVQLSGTIDLYSEALLAELTSLNMYASVNSEKLARVELKQSLSLNGKQNYSGELLQLSLDQFPLDLLNFVLPKPLQVSGAPVSAQIIMNGEPDGALNLVASEPIQFGPVSVNDGERLLLNSLSLGFNPKVHIAANGDFSMGLSSIELSSKGRNLLVGSLVAKVPAVDSVLNASLAQSSGSWVLSLSDLFDQPALSELGDISSGRLQLDWDYNGTLSKTINLKAALSGLRYPKEPRFMPDYRIALQLSPTDSLGYSIVSEVLVGSETSPSSDLLLTANVWPESVPIQFDFKIESDQLIQGDFSQLAEVFTPNPEVEEVNDTNKDSEMTTPPWAAVSGQGTVDIKRLLAEGGFEVTDIHAALAVSEALIAIQGLSAKIGGGAVAGEVSMQYAAERALPFTALANIDFSEIDPSLFKTINTAPLPIKGLFDGLVSAEGEGRSAEAAIENLRGGVELRGKKGVLTAFDIDRRTMSGLSLVGGILGQQLELPGVTAITETLPYFKDIQFSSFDLSLNRTENKQIKVSELKIVGNNLFMEGRGFIAASSWEELTQQPLDLSLSLGAKGPLVNWLETLNLLKPSSNPLGFREWNQGINIGGTLAKPDTQALMDLLKSAANSALSKPAKTDSKADPANPDKAVEKSKTKADKRRDDIDIAVELLNNVFGN